jgi:hypothetical protein
VARMGEGRNVYRVLVGKPEGKRPLVRQRRRWDQKGTYGCWYDRDRRQALMNSVMNICVVPPRNYFPGYSKLNENIIHLTKLQALWKSTNS